MEKLPHFEIEGEGSPGKVMVGKFTFYHILVPTLYSHNIILSFCSFDNGVKSHKKKRSTTSKSRRGTPTQLPRPQLSFSSNSDLHARRHLLSTSDANPAMPHVLKTRHQALTAPPPGLSNHHSMTPPGV